MKTGMMVAAILGGVLLIAGGSVETGKPVTEEKKPGKALNLQISLEDSPAKAWLKAQAGYMRGLNNALGELAAEADTFPESDAAFKAYSKKSVGASATAFVPWEQYVFKTSIDGKQWSSAGLKTRCLEMKAAGEKALEALRPYLE